MTGIQTGTNWKFMLQRCPLIYGFTIIGHFGKVGKLLNFRQHKGEVRGVFLKNEQIQQIGSATTIHPLTLEVLLRVLLRVSEVLRIQGAVLAIFGLRRECVIPVYAGALEIPRDGFRQAYLL